MPPRNAISWVPRRQLNGDEQIVLFMRRHWFVLLVKYLFVLVLALVPLAAYILMKESLFDFSANSLGRTVLTLVASLYYLFLWVSAFNLFIDYYLDIWIVTTHRIIDIEQRGLFNHVVSEQSLENVQDSQSSVQGIFSTLLDFGDVLVQSSGARNLVLFRQIAEPEQVSRVVTRLAAEFREKHQHES